MSQPHGRRSHHEGYATALRLVVAGGATWMSVCEAANTARMSSQRMLRVFHDLGLAHIVGWTGPLDRTPIFAFGPGVDLPGPGMLRIQRRAKKFPIELLTFCNAVKALMSEPLHGQGLAAATGQGARSARATIRVLREQGLVHIADHDDRFDLGAGVPLFAWGPGLPDKPKPKPQTRRALWVKHNAVKARRRAHTKTLHAMSGKIADTQATGSTA